MTCAVKNKTTAATKKKAAIKKTRKALLNKTHDDVQRLKPLPQEEKKTNEYYHLISAAEQKEAALEKAEKEKEAILREVIKKNPKLKQAMTKVTRLEKELDVIEDSTEQFIEKIFKLMKKKCYQGLRFKLQQEMRQRGCAYTKVFEALEEDDIVEEAVMKEYIARFTTQKRRIVLELEGEILKKEEE